MWFQSLVALEQHIIENPDERYILSLPKSDKNIVASMSFTLKQAIFTINVLKFEQRFQISSKFKLNKGMTLSKFMRFYFEHIKILHEPIGVSRQAQAALLFVLY